jgi:fructose-bisphosphate aldolase class I
MDGSHDIDRCDDVTTETLQVVFDALHRQGVSLEGMLLKPNMVISGAGCATQADIDTVAARTVRCLHRTVPAAVPGIVFLSGGQNREVATAHLNAMNANHGPHPWKLSFSYGRALQDLALETWSGSNDKAKAAQDVLFGRAKANGEASLGTFTGEAA